MKLSTPAVAVDSNMPGEKIAMGIQVENMAHIQSMLSSNYQNPLLAVIREYANNGLDAHIEAGISLPVEVKLPNRMSPTLAIRDYGVGMTGDTIERLFSQYGSSTKRDTNEQTGMLGIGSKSGLAYQDQFTVESNRDGRKVIVLVGRDEDGAGFMQVINGHRDLEGVLVGEPTEDANGTTVTIQVRQEDIERCKKLAADLFSYWDEGTVLVDGKEPLHFTELHKTIKVADGMYLIEGNSGLDRVVMGQVPYPQKVEHTVKARNSYDSFSVVFYVPIGAVKPNHSRETLEDVPWTRDTLNGKYRRKDPNDPKSELVLVQDGLAQKFDKALAAMIEGEVAKAKTPAEALQIMSKWLRYQTKAAIQYQGHTIPGFWLPKHTMLKDGRGYYGRTELRVETTEASMSNPATVEKRREIQPVLWGKMVWVKDFAPGKFSAAHKEKLMYWLDQNGIDRKLVDNFVLLRTPEVTPDSYWIDPKFVVDWETIRQLRLPKNAVYNTGPARLQGSYDLYTETSEKYGDSAVAGDKIRDDVPLFWTHGNLVDSRYEAIALKAVLPQFTLVCLPENRIEKFKRDRPKARIPSYGIQEGFAEWRKKQSQEDLDALEMQFSMPRGYNPPQANRYLAYDIDRIDDPEVKRAIRLAKRKIPTFDAMLATRRAVDRWLKTDDLYDPLKKYPLREIQGHPDETYAYMNWLYATTKGA